LILFLVHGAKSNPEADIIAEVGGRGGGGGGDCILNLSIHINMIERHTAEWIPHTWKRKK